MEGMEGGSPLERDGYKGMEGEKKNEKKDFLEKVRKTGYGEGNLERTGERGNWSGLTIHLLYHKWRRRREWRR